MTTYKEAALAVEYALAEYPGLHTDGFRTPELDRILIEKWGKPADYHQRWREELRHEYHLKGVAAALAFIDKCQSIHQVRTRSVRSGWLKVCAEHWTGTYLCNGAMIVALAYRRVHLRLRHEGGRVHCDAAISKKVIAQLSPYGCGDVF